MQAILNALLEDRFRLVGAHRLFEALARIAQARHAFLDVREQFVKREFADCLAAAELTSQKREAAITGG